MILPLFIYYYYLKFVCQGAKIDSDFNRLIGISEVGINYKNKSQLILSLFYFNLKTDKIMQICEIARNSSFKIEKKSGNSALVNKQFVFSVHG